MLTDFQKTKFVKMFNTFDVDNNGYVEQADYERIVEKLALSLKIDVGSAQYQGLRAKYMDNWEQTATMDKDGDGKVDVDEWLADCEATVGSPEQYNELIVAVANQVFDLLDLDGDGEVSSDEYATWLCAHGGSRAAAAEAFTKLDLNGDGHISREEMKILLNDFYFSDDPEAPGTWLFGNLS